MRPHLILCAGLNRSGSTWQFNAIRELLRRAKPEMEIYSCWIADYNPSNMAPFHVVKVHDPADANTLVPNMIVTAYRDLRAVAGSLVRMRWCKMERKPVEAFLDHYVRNCAIWEATAHHVMRYEDMLEYPLGMLTQLSAALDLNLEREQIADAHEAIEALRPAQTTPSGTIANFDPTTLLHDGHIGMISDLAARDQLPPDVIADIEIRYHNWMVDHGFADVSPTLVSRAATWRKAFDRLEASSKPITSLEVDVDISFAAADLPSGLTAFGFDTEEWGSWSVTPLCGLEFALPRVRSRVQLVLLAGALTLPGSQPLIATAYLNGEKINSWLWRDSTDAQELKIDLDPAIDRVALCFLVEGARSARSLKVGQDDRQLGLALQSLKIVSLPD
jgi:hypothetical protein